MRPNEVVLRTRRLLHRNPLSHLPGVPDHHLTKGFMNDLDHERYLRRAIESAGNVPDLPFGAVIVDRATGLFSCRPPGGESYAEVGARLHDWLDEHRPSDRPRLVVMHGMSARVLRGLLVGTGYRSPCGAPVAPGLRQGAVVEVVDGRTGAADAGRHRRTSRARLAPGKDRHAARRDRYR